MPFWVAVYSCYSQSVCILCTVQNGRSWEKLEVKKSSSNFRQMFSDASVNHKAKCEHRNLSGGVKAWGSLLLSQEGTFVKYNNYWSLLIPFVFFAIFKFVTGTECSIQNQWLSLFSGFGSGIKLLYKYKLLYGICCF